SEDFQFPGAQGRTRTPLLEEKIARLESRIHELEYPDEIPSTVTLYDPYTSRQGSPMDRGTPVNATGERRASSASGNNAAQRSYEAYADVIPVGSAGSSTESYRNALLRPGGSPPSAFENTDSWWNSDEPPLH